MRDDELQQCLVDRLERLLEWADTPCDTQGSRISHYEEALSVSRKGYAVVYKRDISEIFVNTYKE